MLTGISVLNFPADGIVHQSPTWVYLWHRQIARAHDPERNNFKSTELKRLFQSLECLSSFSERTTAASSGTAGRERWRIWERRAPNALHSKTSQERMPTASGARRLQGFPHLWKDADPDIPILIVI